MEAGPGGRRAEGPRWRLRGISQSPCGEAAVAQVGDHAARPRVAGGRQGLRAGTWGGRKHAWSMGDGRVLKARAKGLEKQACEMPEDGRTGDPAGPGRGPQASGGTWCGHGSSGGRPQSPRELRA